MKGAAEEMADAGPARRPDPAARRRARGVPVSARRRRLLEVIEGNDPLPRWLPPYLHGLFATRTAAVWGLCDCGGLLQAHEAEPGHEWRAASNPNPGQQTPRPLANVSHISGARRAEVVSGRWGRRSRRGRSSATVRRRRGSAPGRGRGRARHAASAPCSTIFGGARPGANDPRRVLRRVQSGAGAPTTSTHTALQLRGGWRRSGAAGWGAAGFIVYDDNRVHGRGLPGAVRGFLAGGVVRAVPARASSARGEVTDGPRPDRDGSGRPPAARPDPRAAGDRGPTANRCYLAGPRSRRVRVEHPDPLSPRDGSSPISKLRVPRPAGHPDPPRSSTSPTEWWCTNEPPGGAKRPDWTYAAVGVGAGGAVPREQRTPGPR